MAYVQVSEASTHCSRRRVDSTWWPCMVTLDLRSPAKTEMILSGDMRELRRWE